MVQPVWRQTALLVALPPPPSACWAQGSPYTHHLTQGLSFLPLLLGWGCSPPRAPSSPPTEKEQRRKQVHCCPKCLEQKGPCVGLGQSPAPTGHWAAAHRTTAMLAALGQALGPPLPLISGFSSLAQHLARWPALSAALLWEQECSSSRAASVLGPGVSTPVPVSAPHDPLLPGLLVQPGDLGWAVLAQTLQGQG